MNDSKNATSIILTAAAVVACTIGVCVADDELQQQASWAPPEPTSVRQQVDRWVAEKQLSEDDRQAIQAVWNAPPTEDASTDMLERVVASAERVEPTAQALIQTCRSQQADAVTLPNATCLDNPELPPWVTNNLRLYYARWLAQHDLYDEVLHQIEGLSVEDVVAPATLLFYQSVAHHRLLHKEQCLPALEKLLERKGQLPRRYEQIALLMEADIKPLKTDSLDEISRLMDDVGRRLHLGRAGTRVRNEEDDVIEKLDKLIKDAEDRLQQMKQASSNSNGQQQSSRPMEDSQAAGGSGPGDVDQRSVGSESGWGNLPPKQRQEALQNIAKGLPSHYRDVIEEYFRKLARDGND